MNTLYSYSILTMGSECFLFIYADLKDEADRAAELAIREIYRIENKYSRFLPESELSKINRMAMLGASIDLDAETLNLMNLAQLYFTKSEGLFDITAGRLRKIWNSNSQKVPDPKQIQNELEFVGFNKLQFNGSRLSFSVAGIELDLGGIAKEYAADRAALVCMDNGIRSGLINLAGDIRLIGPHPDGSGWKVDINNPNQSGIAAVSVLIEQGGLATSGDYERFITIEGERYSHIVNPLTGWPVRGLASVTVHSENCVAAGCLSTISILLQDQYETFLKENSSSYIWIDREGGIGGNRGAFPSVHYIASI